MNEEAKINILAISGSLRKKSSNSALLQAVTRLDSESFHFTVYDGLGNLPHFNPDIDGDGDEAPAPVQDLRRRLKEADGVLVCTPEYANGVPGVLKNALDWIVSSGEFLGKPTAVISASPHPLGGEKAHASLLLTLAMLDARVIEGATLMIPFISRKLNAEGDVLDLETEQALRAVLGALQQAI